MLRRQQQYRIISTDFSPAPALYHTDWEEEAVLLHCTMNAVLLLLHTYNCCCSRYTLRMPSHACSVCWFPSLIASYEKLNPLLLFNGWALWKDRQHDSHKTYFVISTHAEIEQPSTQNYTPSCSVHHCTGGTPSRSGTASSSLLGSRCDLLIAQALRVEW